MQTAFALISAFLAVVAAATWHRSATIWVPAPAGVEKGHVPGRGIFDDDTSGRRYDVVETIKAQSKWNRIASISAAGAAIFHGLTLLRFALW
jgi:hypothetical protein